MDARSNKQAVLDYLRAWETKDLELLASVVTDDFSHEMLGEVRSRVQLFADVAGTPFVRSQFDVDALVEEGDHVACRYRFRGETDRGRVVAFTGMFIARMREGRLASGWGEYDARRVEAQLAD